MSILAVGAGLAAWVAVALALPALMSRRGHSRIAWQALAIMMGPFVLLLALPVFVAPPARPPTLVAAGQRRRGVDALVCLESRDSLASATRALAHGGPLLGRLIAGRPPSG
jgi:hypothetical protein